MYRYRVTFCMGASMIIRGNSPKEAWQRAYDTYGLEILMIKYIGGH